MWRSGLSRGPMLGRGCISDKDHFLPRNLIFYLTFIPLVSGLFFLPFFMSPPHLVPVEPLHPPSFRCVCRDPTAFLVSLPLLPFIWTKSGCFHVLCYFSLPLKIHSSNPGQLQSVTPFSTFSLCLFPPIPSRFPHSPILFPLLYSLHSAGSAFSLRTPFPARE